MATGTVEVKPRGGTNADVPLAEAAGLAVAWIQERLAALNAAAEAVR